MKLYYENSIDVKEHDEILDEFTDIIYQADEQTVRKYLKILSDYFIGGFNTYKSVDKYVKSHMRERWDKAASKIIEHGNYGWSMILIKMLEDMEEEINYYK